MFAPVLSPVWMVFDDSQCNSHPEWYISLILDYNVDYQVQIEQMALVIIKRIVVNFGK